MPTARRAGAARCRTSASVRPRPRSSLRRWAIPGARRLLLRRFDFGPAVLVARRHDGRGGDPKRPPRGDGQARSRGYRVVEPGPCRPAGDPGLHFRGSPQWLGSRSLCHTASRASIRNPSISRASELSCSGGRPSYLLPSKCGNCRVNSSHGRTTRTSGTSGRVGMTTARLSPGTLTGPRSRRTGNSVLPRNLTSISRVKTEAANRPACCRRPREGTSLAEHLARRCGHV